MPLARRTTAVALSLLAVLAFAGCGVEAGDQAATTTTTPSKDLSAAEQAAADRVAGIYEDMGMDPDDADCLAKAIAGSVDTLDPTNPSQMMDIVNQCDISIAELNELTKDQGLTSVEDGLKFGLETSLKELGLTDTQASCVADAYIDEFGTDVTGGQDIEKMKPLFEKCDVDPSKYGG